MSFFFILCSWIFGLIVKVRHYCYDRGFLPSFRSRVITVSIGNLVVGGSGKTPIVALFVTLLIAEHKVAIATRGYKGRAEKRRTPLFAKDAKGQVRSWHLLGDEPYWLARTFRDVGLFVGRKRLSSASKAYKKGYDLLLLDDGMQHRKLQRDIEIVVVEGRDPFGGGHFLPRGRLREDPKRIAYADLVIVNGAMSVEENKKLRSLTGAPLVHGEMKVRRVINRRGKEVEMQGKNVALFCAIGSPQRFVETVTSYGACVVSTYFLPDHQPFDRIKWIKFAESAKKSGAEYFCCTEKDGVKLFEDEKYDEQIAIIEAEFVIHENEESLRQIVSRIKALAKEKR